MLYNILYVIYSHNQLISSRNFLQFRSRNNDNIVIDKSNSRTRNNSSKFRSSDVWKRSRFVIFSINFRLNFRLERNQLKLNLSKLTHCWNDDFRLGGGGSLSLSTQFNNFIRIGIFCCGVCAFLCLTYSYDSLDINRAQKKNMVSLLDVKNVSMNMYVLYSIQGFIATLL